MILFSPTCAMIRHTNVLLFLIAFLASACSLHAGAWTQKQSQIYAKISLLRFESDSQFLLSGEQERFADNGRVLDLGFYFYAEYGLFDNLTLIGSLPFKRINFSCSTTDCNQSSAGIGDIYGGFRYRLAGSSWIVSLQSGVKVATGYETNPTNLGSAPPLGDGQTDVDFHILLGRSILRYQGYVNFDLGYRARSGDPVDEIPFAFEIGVNLASQYMLIGQLYGIVGISGNQSQQDFQIVDGTIQNFVGTGAVEEFLKGQVQLSYRLNPLFDLSFLFEQVLSGKNTAKATILGVGLALYY